MTTKELLDTKKWLSRGRKVDAEINQLLEEKSKLLTIACQTTLRLKENIVQESEINSSETQFINYISYALMIDNHIDSLYKIKSEIVNIIAMIDNATYRALLTARYINFKNWNVVANDIQYDYYHVVKYLHPQSLKKVDAIRRLTNQ